MLVSGGFVVIDEDTCMVRCGAAHYAFLRARICVWCIPCREAAAGKNARPLPFRWRPGEDIPWSANWERICSANVLPLGDAAAMPRRSVIVKKMATNSSSIFRASAL